MLVGAASAGRNRTSAIIAVPCASTPNSPPISTVSPANCRCRYPSTSPPVASAWRRSSAAFRRPPTASPVKIASSRCPDANCACASIGRPRVRDRRSCTSTAAAGSPAACSRTTAHARLSRRTRRRSSPASTIAWRRRARFRSPTTMHSPRSNGWPQTRARSAPMRRASPSAATARARISRAGLAQEARDRGIPLAFQLLIYPVIEPDFETSSYREHAVSATLTRADMIDYWAHYLGGALDTADPRAVPSRAASLAGLPPAHVVVAELDPLRDEGVRYADAAARRRRRDDARRSAASRARLPARRAVFRCCARCAGCARHRGGSCARYHRIDAPP